MNKPNTLYRGAKEKVDVLLPQPILDSEKSRFPLGVEEVVYADTYKQSALAYAIASRRGLGGGFQVAPFWKNQKNGEIGWKLNLSCSESDLDVNEPAFLYEVESTNFELNEMGEWYSTKEVKPKKVDEIKIGDALDMFDEVNFSIDKEAGINGEGQKGLLL